jgi:hypothetical protein
LFWLGHEPKKCNRETADAKKRGAVDYVWLDFGFILC